MKVYILNSYNLQLRLLVWHAGITLVLINKINGTLTVRYSRTWLAVRWLTSLSGGKPSQFKWVKPSLAQNNLRGLRFHAMNPAICAQSSSYFMTDTNMQLCTSSNISMLFDACI